MAVMIPDTPISCSSADHHQVYRQLKRLPDTYKVWQRLTTDREAGPDFWVLRQDYRCALVTVARADQAAIKRAGQADLFDTTVSVGAAEQVALHEFRGALELSESDVPGLLVFPKIQRNQLRQAVGATPNGMHWAAAEDLKPEAFAEWIDARLGIPLTNEHIERMRAYVTPEVVVPCSLTVRATQDRNISQQLHDFLLSYDQEWALKHDLDLSDEADTASDNLRLNLITGVTGSGKSLVLVYRARLLRQFFPNKRILVLTHNKPLLRDLERRYHQLTNHDNSIEWRTFQSWCYSYMPRQHIIGSTERRELIRRAWQQHLGETSISQERLEDEIGWLKDRLITTEQEYLEADRKGRGFALNSDMRRRVYTAIHSYDLSLRNSNRSDFHDLPRRIWRALDEQPERFPHYDIVLIDEAQFFAPIWFEIIQRIVTPRTGAIFMVADPTQGFLKRGQSWLASGIDVRGRSQRLEKSYRTTRAILSYATSFYQQRLPDDDEALIAGSMRHMPEGKAPEIVSLTSEQDEVTRVVNEIRELVQSGVPLEHIMVLHADWQNTQRVLERLRAEFGYAQVAHAKYRPAEPHIRVCQIDSAAGLESPIVFLMGAHRLCEAEQSVRLSEDERREKIRDTTRRLYMAMTRAGQRLVLTYVGRPPAELNPVTYIAA